MNAIHAARTAVRSTFSTGLFGGSCFLLLFLAPTLCPAESTKVPLPFVASAEGTRWDEPDFSYSIPALDAGWTVKPEAYNEPSDNLDRAREVVSFTANGGSTRIELTVWDKKRKHSLKEWYNKFGKQLCGTVGVSEEKIKTPAGDNAIWVNVEATEQAPQTEFFFITSRNQAFLLRYINTDDGANREAYKQLCLGFLPRLGSAAPAKLTPKAIGAPAAAAISKVSSCGGVVDACICGGNNPYPCCYNGSNCTWGAWDRMCCNWGYAARNWGNAETWDNYAQVDGLWVQSTPTVGSVACRNVHSDTPFGHVAYVLQISGSSVYVIQMNCNVGGAGWSYQWFPISWFTGGYITLTNPAPSVFVIDNTSSGFSASSNWSTGTSAADKYGTNYRFRSTAAVSDAANWTVNIPVAANYTIAAWWSAGSNRSSSAPYILPNGNTIHKNQQTSGGSWQNLGTVWLGTGNRTTKLSCWTTAGFVVIADAIRYTRN